MQREQLLKPQEVADWLGVSRGWVRDHSKDTEPKLPVKRLGRCLRYRAEDIEEFLRKHGIDDRAA